MFAWGIAIRRILSSRIGLIGVALALAFTWHVFDKRQAVKAAYQNGYAVRSQEADEATDALNAKLANAARETRALEAQVVANEAAFNDLYEELGYEAQRDPDAGRRALGADGVRRLNQIGQ